jgi:hypothetical protein
MTSGGAELTVAILPRSGKVTLTTMDARLPLAQFDGMLKAAMRGSRQIAALLNESAVEHATQALKRRRGGAAAGVDGAEASAAGFEAYAAAALDGAYEGDGAAGAGSAEGLPGGVLGAPPGGFDGDDGDASAGASAAARIAGGAGRGRSAGAGGAAMAEDDASDEETEGPKGARGMVDAGFGR